jgi:hypothetical protein
MCNTHDEQSSEYERHDPGAGFESETVFGEYFSK